MGREVPVPTRHSAAQQPQTDDDSEGISIADIVKKAKQDGQKKKMGCLPAIVGSAAFVLIVMRLVEFLIHRF